MVMPNLVGIVAVITGDQRSSIRRRIMSDISATVIQKLYLVFTCVVKYDLSHTI